MENILISACLLGKNCKYDGKNNKIDDKILSYLKNNFNLIPFCPERLGGLDTPRNPSEIKGNKVMDNKGNDVTKFFKKGAKKSLKLAHFYRPKYIILKSKSPSCGIGEIYNGEFNKTIIKGDGLTAQALKKAGFNLLTEKDDLLCLLKE